MNTADETTRAMLLMKAAEQMAEALAPFAAMAEHYPKGRTYGIRPMSGVVYAVSTGGFPTAEITVEDFHAARAALAAARGEEA